MNHLNQLLSLEPDHSGPLFLWAGHRLRFPRRMARDLYRGQSYSFDCLDRHGQMSGGRFLPAIALQILLAATSECTDCGHPGRVAEEACPWWVADPGLVILSKRAPKLAAAEGWATWVRSVQSVPSTHALFR